MMALTAPSKNELAVRVLPSRAQAGKAAAADVAAYLRDRLSKADHVRMIFAAAPSQTELLQALAQEPGINWSRVTAFHMDEYIGLAADAPERFALWLRRHFFDKVPLAK